MTWNNEQNFLTGCTILSTSTEICCQVNITLKLQRKSIPCRVFQSIMNSIVMNMIEKTAISFLTFHRHYKITQETDDSTSDKDWRHQIKNAPDGLKVGAIAHFTLNADQDFCPHLYCFGITPNSFYNSEICKKKLTEFTCSPWKIWKFICKFLSKWFWITILITRLKKIYIGQKSY